MSNPQTFSAWPSQTDFRLADFNNSEAGPQPFGCIKSSAVLWQISRFRIRIPFVATIPKQPFLVRECFFAVVALALSTLPGLSRLVLASQDQNPPQQDVSFSVEGTISEKSAGKLTVDSGQNLLFTVKYDSTTQIQHDDGSAAQASDLRVGVRILAKGVLTEAGDVIAKTITIEAKSKGHAKPPEGHPTAAGFPKS
jgi:hypothetical protein